MVRLPVWFLFVFVIAVLSTVAIVMALPSFGVDPQTLNRTLWALLIGMWLFLLAGYGLKNAVVVL